MDIPQFFKGARPKQSKSRGGGKGKQPQQKPKDPPAQIQDNQYNYEDTNNYYHNENYRGQSRGCRPYRAKIQVDSLEATIHMAEVNEIRAHIRTISK